MEENYIIIHNHITNVILLAPFPLFTTSNTQIYTRPHITIKDYNLFFSTNFAFGFHLFQKSKKHLEI